MVKDDYDWVYFPIRIYGDTGDELELFLLFEKVHEYKN